MRRNMNQNETSRNPLLTSPTALSVRGSSGRAFTLIEALVAIGAMTLVAVGIAQIFQSVGKTLTVGRRLNVVNTQVAMLEQQMRRDFAAMTRDGFLLIRNSYADGHSTGGNVGTLERPPAAPAKPDPTKDDTIRLSSQDTRPRLRRVDELMFFAKGDFASAREPLDPKYVARSKEARIYYGHGLKMTGTQQGNTSGVSAYLSPDVNDGITLRSNRLGRSGRPNEYAKDWTLLRQPTLLVRPETAQQQLPPDTVFGWKPTIATQAAFLMDHPGQIALQPAATSIFRSLNKFRANDTYSYARPSLQANRSVRALFESGLIDIATEDLGAIRTIALSPTPTQFPPTTAGTLTAPDGVFELLPWADPKVPPLAMHAWMDDAWPAQSDPSVAARDSAGNNVPGGLRIRYESGPINYVGALVATGTSANPAAELASLRSDQLMMSASNFLPGCTEFIVEYSFGVVHPVTKQLVWHGLKRDADVGDGSLPRAIVLPYPELAPPAGTRDASFSPRYTNLDGDSVTDRTYTSTTGAVVTALNPAVPPELIYSKKTDPNDLSQTAHFGYLDPLVYIDPTTVSGLKVVPDGRPWAWPTLVRVTLSLTDPNNPTSEETFQFVFPTAANPG